MQIAKNPSTIARSASSAAPKPAESLQVKPELEPIADRYNDSRALGNYVSGMTLGAAKETVATAAQSPILAYEIVENLWQAETIGPNLKILGTLAAIPGAALSIPLAPFYGAFTGWSAVRHSNKESQGPLLNDSNANYAASVFASPADGEARTMTGGFINGLEEFGAKKLEAGEKPFDVPILSPVFALTGGIVSGVVSGAVGLVAGLVAGGISAGKQCKHAVTDEGKGFGQRVGEVLSSPLNLVVGPALAWNGIKESVPRGLVDGWNHGPFKPVVDTAKASAGLAGSVIKEAWER